jgi:hypothetical protein
MDLIPDTAESGSGLHRARLRSEGEARADRETARAARLRVKGACLVCGCTEDHACEGGCHWVAPRLCSACVAHAASVCAIVGREKSTAIVRGLSVFDEMKRARTILDHFTGSTR